MLSHSLFLHTLLFYTNLGIQTSKKFLINKNCQYFTGSHVFKQGYYRKRVVLCQLYPTVTRLSFSSTSATISFNKVTN